MYVHSAPYALYWSIPALQTNGKIGPKRRLAWWSTACRGNQCAAAQEDCQGCKRRSLGRPCHYRLIDLLESPHVFAGEEMESIFEMERRQTAAAGLGDLPAFVTLPSKSSHELSSDAQGVFNKIAEVRTNLILTTIEAQTRDEFIVLRAKVFSDVVRTNKAMGSLARVMVPAPALDRITWQAFAELEAELTEYGVRKFGEEAKEQAIFTVWALRKINRLLSKILTKPLEGEQAEKDREIAKEFSFYLLWAYFHLECLVAAMRYDKPIQIDVLDEICDGMRAAVNSYGLLRQGLSLRLTQDPAPEDIEWSEEDKELLASSMDDMASMDIGEY